MQLLLSVGKIYRVIDFETFPKETAQNKTRSCGTLILLDCQKNIRTRVWDTKHWGLAQRNFKSHDSRRHISGQKCMNTLLNRVFKRPSPRMTKKS